MAATDPEPPTDRAAQEIVNAAAPEPAPTESLGEPTAARDADMRQIATSESPPAHVANDVAPEPIIRPIIIGSGEAVPEKKRGWWRR
jgi:hypothetical protein